MLIPWKYLIICLNLIGLFTFSLSTQAQEETDEAALLTNEFSIFYQNSLHAFQHQNVSARGWRENQLRASGQIRFNPDWLFRATIMGDRSDIELANFASNPVFSTDSFSGELSANYLWFKQSKLTLASGLSYLFYSYTPDNLDQSNQPIAYTGSFLDYEQAQQGVGFYSIAAYQLLENVSLQANASLYPYLFTQVKKGPSISYSMMGRANLQLRYTMVEGFLLSAFVNQEVWAGDVLSSNSSLGLGLTLIPGQIPQE